MFNETFESTLTPVAPAARQKFYSKELIVLGCLPVRAHERVSDAALFVAADRLSRMLRLMPSAVLYAKDAESMPKMPLSASGISSLSIAIESRSAPSAGRPKKFLIT